MKHASRKITRYIMDNFNSRISVILFISLLTFNDALALNAKPGELLSSFQEKVYFFAKNPFNSEIYATTSNNILVINPEKNIIEKIPAADEPRGLALSMDAKRLYVATTAVNQIMVIDTVARKVMDPIKLPRAPYDIKLGAHGYLYATAVAGFGSDSYPGFMQIDTKNKSVKEFKDFNQSIYPKSLVEVSPDRNTIYFANVGISSSKLYKYDVSTKTPNLIYENPWNKLGGNGLDLHLTSKGDYIYFVNGTGNSTDYTDHLPPFDIVRIRTLDMSFQGALLTPPAMAITTSPDGEIAYTYSKIFHEFYYGNTSENQNIKVWNTETKKNICDYSIKTNPDIAIAFAKLITDNDGKYLLVSLNGSLFIYRTGCP